MRFRLFMIIATLALACGFTLVSPIDIAFAEDTEYQRISADKWMRENCDVIVINVQNLPFYLEYRKRTEAMTWAIGSYRRNLATRLRPDLISENEEDKDFIAPSPKSGICIRILGKIAPAPTGENAEDAPVPLKSTVHTGVFQVGEKAHHAEIDSTKFQVDWRVVQVTTPKNIVQKDIEIGKPLTQPNPRPTPSPDPTDLQYQPLVANTLLAEKMTMDSERGIDFRFKSAGIYNLKVTAEINYSDSGGVKPDLVANNYTVIVGDEITFKKLEKIPDKDPDKVPDPNKDKKPEEKKPVVIPEEKPDIPTSVPNMDPVSPDLLEHSDIGSRNQTIVPRLENILPPPLENKNPAEKNSAGKKRANSEKPNTRKKAANDSGNSSSTSSKSDRTEAQEAVLDFLRTAPLIVAGTVVLIGVGETVTIFRKIKP